MEGNVEHHGVWGTDGTWQGELCGGKAARVCVCVLFDNGTALSPTTDCVLLPLTRVLPASCCSQSGRASKARARSVRYSTWGGAGEGWVEDNVL